MVLLLAAVGVLLAGALLPMAFDDGHDDDTPEAELGDASEEAGDFLNDLRDEDGPDLAASEAVFGDPVPVSSVQSDVGLTETGSVEVVPEVAVQADATPEVAAPQAPPMLEDIPPPEPDPDPVLSEDEGWGMFDPLEEAPDCKGDPDAETGDVLVEEDDGGRLHLTGTAEDESISVPARAFVKGGGGSDVFTLDGATQIGEQAEIVDFDPEDDRVVVVWDDSAVDTPPKLSLGAIEDAAHMTQILADGVVIAHVSDNGDLRVEDIDLCAKSAL